jgi:hypothetical protein
LLLQAAVQKPNRTPLIPDQNQAKFDEFALKDRFFLFEISQKKRFYLPVRRGDPCDRPDSTMVITKKGRPAGRPYIDVSPFFAHFDRLNERRKKLEQLLRLLEDAGK